MSSGLYSHTTRAIGTVLTAAIYNSDHQNHITNLNPIMMGGYQDSVAQMQANADPGGLGSEVLAGSIAAELEQIRFSIARIQGTTHWYQAPATDLSGAGGPDPLVLSFLAQTPLTIIREENTTAEVEVENIRSGSGVGNQHSRRIVGGGANNVASIREYIGATEIFRATSSERINQTNHHFNAGLTVGVAGDRTIYATTAGFIEFEEILTPPGSAANIGRLYFTDVSGATKLAYMNSSGVQVVVESTVVPAFVQGVRLGTVAQTAVGDGIMDLAAGNVCTGIVTITGDPKNPGAGGVTHLRHKPLQQSISDSWATVSG